MKLRPAARCWNAGDKYGPYGAFFFSMLEMDQFERYGHLGTPGNKRELTLLEKRNLFLDCARKFGLHPLPEEITSESVDVSSFG